MQISFGRRAANDNDAMFMKAMREAKRAKFLARNMDILLQGGAGITEAARDGVHAIYAEKLARLD